MAHRCLPLLAFALLVPLAAGAQTAEVTFDRGLVSIHCNNSPLSSVFEELERAAGIELILEDDVKSRRLTAALEDVPVAMAVQRLLEGVGVNYAVMMDPRDWGRVDKVFIGAGGGGPSRPAPPPRRAPTRVPEPAEEDDYDDMEDYDDEFDDMEDMSDDMDDELVDDPNGDLGDDPGAFPNPPGSSPVPSYLPPQQAFPRSNFTPGLPNNQTQPQQQQQPGNPSNPPPPATFPFMDALGRPIPVPPDMNQQQQQQRQRQQQQQQN